MRKISHGVYPESLRRVRDDKYLFSCHFEREREIFLDVKTHGRSKINHYPIGACLRPACGDVILFSDGYEFLA